MIKNYLLIAFRNIKKHKGYSFINIAGLAIGMACCILILLWVRDELNYDRFHKNANDLYKITVSHENNVWDSSPWALVPVLKRDFPEISKGTRYFNKSFLVKYKENSYFEECALVDKEFFDMFTFPFTRGDPKSAFSNINSVVITERTAEKYFGPGDPMGQILNFENRVDLKVTGVIQNIPANSHLKFDLLASPVHYFGKGRMRTWSMDCPSYVLLKKNVDPDEVRRKISGTIIKYDKRTNNKYYIDLQPLKKIHLYALSGTDPIIYLYIFSSIAIIVLLIACINFMNLSTAGSAVRTKEIGLRKIFGAVRRDLIKQFLGESIFLALIALIFAVILVYLFLPIFNNLALKQLKFDILGDYSILITLIIISLITGLVSGSYPAFYFSSFQPANVLKGSLYGGYKSNLLRRTLTIIQFMAAIVLMISTSTIYRQMNYISTKDLGFTREHILAIPMNRERRNNYDIIKQELLLNKDILNVTAASNIPLGIDNSNPVYWEGRSSEQYVPMNFVCLDYDYFETFNMKMVYGRSFSQKFSTDRKNYIINEAALKLTGYKDPIGKMFSMWEDEGQIVGVVKDFHATSLHNEIEPIVFVLYENLPYFYMYVKINSANLQGAIKFLKSTVEKFSPGYPVTYQFLDEYFARQYWSDQRIGNILKYFTFLAIFISCLGLFGLAAFMTARRSKEIAIRKVLGASITNVVGILSKEFVILVFCANIIAWPLAYYFMSKWIQNFAFHPGLTLWLFVIAGTIALVIALFTVSYQTLRAAAANPVDKLRNE